MSKELACSVWTKQELVINVTETKRSCTIRSLQNLLEIRNNERILIQS